MKLIANNQEYECSLIILGKDYVLGFDINGACQHKFGNIIDFSNYLVDDVPITNSEKVISETEAKYTVIDLLESILLMQSALDELILNGGVN